MAFLEEGNNSMQADLDRTNHTCQPYQIHDNLFSVCKQCSIVLHPLHPLITYHRLEKHKSVNFSQEFQISLEQMKHKQRCNRLYVQNPKHKNFRLDTIKYIRTIAAKLQYKEKTFYIAIAIMDLALAEYEFGKNEIMLICIISLILAAKVNEPNHKIPYIDQVIQKSEGRWTEDDYLFYEQKIFQKTLNFNADIKTTYYFVQEFLSLGVLSNIETGFDIIDKNISQQIMEFFYEIVKIITDFSLNIYQLYMYDASTVAAAIIMLARKLFGFKQCWNQHLTNLTSEDEQGVRSCAEKIAQFMNFSQKFQNNMLKKNRFYETSMDYQSFEFFQQYWQGIQKLTQKKLELKQIIINLLQQEKYTGLSSPSELLNCSLEQLLLTVRNLKEQDQTRSQIDILLYDSNLLHNNKFDEDNSLLDILFKKL